MNDTRKNHFTLTQLADVNLSSYRNLARFRQGLAGFDQRGISQKVGETIPLDRWYCLGLQIACDLSGEGIPTPLLKNALRILKEDYPDLMERADKADPDDIPQLYVVAIKSVSKRKVVAVEVVDFTDKRDRFFSMSSAGGGRIVMINVFECARRIQESLEKIQLEAESAEAQEELEIA